MPIPTPLPVPDAPTVGGLTRALAGWPASWTAAGVAPLGLISDAHGWHGRLHTMLDGLASLGIPKSRVICLGDLVDYGPDAASVIRTVRELHHCVVGNHDMSAVSIGAIFGAGNMTDDDWEFLRRLTKPDRHHHRVSMADLFPIDDCADDQREVLFIHDAPSAMRTGPGSAGNRIRRPADAVAELNVMADAGLDLCFYGHTHIPTAFARPAGGSPGSVVSESGPNVELDAGARYLINVGSTGVQRDGSTTPRAGVLTPWWYSHIEVPLPPGVP